MALGVTREAERVYVGPVLRPPKDAQNRLHKRNVLLAYNIRQLIRYRIRIKLQIWDWAHRPEKEKKGYKSCIIFIELDKVR